MELLLVFKIDVSKTEEQKIAEYSVDKKSLKIKKEDLEDKFLKIYKSFND